MLKNIKIDNFTTFVKPTTIDFSATNYKFLEENVSASKILKSTLFVGENASGKTQVLKAISLLLDLLFENNDINFLVYKSFYNNKPSFKLSYDFDIESNDIFYEIELGIDKIINEKLIVNNEIIISRMGKNADFIYQNETRHFDDLNEKLLFIRRIYFDTKFYNNVILIKWFDFLKNSISVNCYNRIIRSYNNSKLLNHEYLDENGTKTINDFFEKINYNQKIKFDTSTDNKEVAFNMKSNDNSKFVSFMKDDTNVYIPEQFESTGNLTLIQLLPLILHAINNDCLLIVDEFSSGFHNELEECLIKYFQHYSKKSQMIFTSHSTNLLNNTIIRPDQIYSVSFKGTKGSIVKRFSEEMPREAQNTEKMYLNGVFDGMPRYNKTFKD